MDLLHAFAPLRPMVLDSDEEEALGEEDLTIIHRKA